MSSTRAGINSGPCENFDPAKSFVQNVTAGSRLKVGWLSGNRGGGFVKLSLAPAASTIEQSNFDSGVLKVTCFGHDQRPNRFSFGSCNHACNARGGCDFQSDPSDLERFDTTITVPYNVEGLQFLQLEAYVGVSLSPVYSCSALNVVGGDSSLPCSAPAAIPVANTCESVSSITSDDLITGVSAGKFCFNSDGTAAIDDNIASVPVNSECDPRVSCGFANLAQLCQADITQTILDPTVSPHVASCTLTAWTPPTSAPKTATTTAIEIVTTEAPVPTTEAPVPTTEAPVPTTEVPVPTTEVPVLTTEVPVPTTEVPVPTEAPSVTTTTENETATYSTTTCVSSNAVIAPGSSCDASSALKICSGSQIAICSQYETLSGYFGKYLFIDCPEGTVCDQSCGHPVCSLANTNICPPYVEPLPPAPKPEYPAPQPEYSAPQPEYSAPQPEYSAPKPEYPAPQPEYQIPVDIPKNPPTQREEVYAPTEIYTKDPESVDCPPKKCYPLIDESSECDVLSAKITCSGLKIAQCANSISNGSVVGKWVFTSCGEKTECRLYDGNPVCDYAYKPCSY